MIMTSSGVSTSKIQYSIISRRAISCKIRTTHLYYTIIVGTLKHIDKSKHKQDLKLKSNVKKYIHIPWLAFRPATPYDAEKLNILAPRVQCALPDSQANSSIGTPYLLNYSLLISISFDFL